MRSTPLPLLAALAIFAVDDIRAQAPTPPTPEAPAPITVPPPPRSHVPSAIALEVSLLERTFETALAADCAPERCFPKGCVYVRHQTIDQPRSGSLPGLPVEQGIGSVPAQEYLTEARCEFTHERSVNPKDLQALVRRLELRLSRGYRKVTVAPQALEPINKSLAEPTVPPEEQPQKAPEPEEQKEEPPPPPPVVEETPTSPWRELWEELLPHTAWMVAILLLTSAIVVLIWASRKLGAPTLEEKMILAQLAQNPPPPPEPTAVDADADPDHGNETDEDASFAEQQERQWRERMAGVENHNGPIAELLREWLKVGDFPMLARAVFTFGDGLAKSFSTEPDLALKKIEFAEYFREVDENTLPSRSEFFRRLNQHAMSSLLMSQSDVQLYRSLREDFGSGGVLSLMQALPRRFSALLFALVPRETQYDVARLMPAALQTAVAEQLLASTRISREESAFIFSCIDAALDGRALPKPPAVAVTDRGPSVDAAAALSVLLPLMPATARAALFTAALQGSASAPQWYEDIFFGDMLERLEPEQRKDLLLDVDVRGLAAWLSMQELEWQRQLTASLSPAMQGAIRSNSTFASRAEQAALARRGQQDITKALKGQYARGRASFLTLVGGGGATATT
jgi:hypothetical protein